MAILMHVLAGGLALGTGYVALAATKGSSLHRRSGMLFVYTMLAMACSGTAIAAIQGVAPAINVPAGMLTAYLVITALTTVRPPSGTIRRIDRAAMLVALAGGRDQRRPRYRQAGRRRRPRRAGRRGDHGHLRRHRTARRPGRPAAITFGAARRRRAPQAAPVAHVHGPPHRVDGVLPGPGR